MMILEEFHLLSADGAARLLKTIEEPPDSTTFLILADFVPHDLITISSRCARIDFRAVSPSPHESAEGNTSQERINQHCERLAAEHRIATS